MPSPPSDPPAQSLFSLLTEGGTGSDGLSREMIWVIIVAVIAAAIFLGCIGVYFCAKRASRAAEAAKIRSVAVVGPAAPPAPRPSAQATAEAKAAHDARLIGLGMALERQQSLGGASNASAPPIGRMPTEDELRRAQANLMQATQAALNVASSLSPRSPRANPEARVAATQWLNTAMANIASPSSSVEGSPCGFGGHRGPGAGHGAGSPRGFGGAASLGSSTEMRI